MTILLAACGTAADTKPGPIVLAAASLQGALDEAADSWAAQGHARPVIAYAGTPVLARQIEAGAPADILFAADEQWMDVLEQKQLIRPDTRRSLYGNRLVLISISDGSRIQVTDQAETILRAIGTSKLAIADPASVPAGRYAKQVLDNLDLWATVEQQVVPTDNVRSAARLVEIGEATLGIVYESDLVGTGKITQIGRFADAVQPPIRYPLAVVASAQHPDAQSFADFLASAEAEAIFLRHKFTRLPEL
ncbi:molybdate ABC transporter substrate-binding protein [Pontixanthobacter aquaemixtae]|uniref:molybdate ABC transporter substrate-binding protein n=1 Tax=Pontixanthobacter aquaemixtae TaxID=1958940 RepID=UPI002E255D55